MGRQLRRVLSTLAAVCLMLAASSAPAAARTTGSESLKAVLVASGASGERTLVSSVVIARGVFNGVGRIVEIQNPPGDPDNVLRDDVVFADGVLHLVSESGAVSFQLNPRTCIFTLRVEQTTTIVGGSGRFRAATGSLAGTLRGRGLAARNADGSCSQERAPLFEVDSLAGSGSLSF